MISREIHNDGLLVVTECSGKVTAEELFTSANWMVDNFGGLVKPGFKQMFIALDADTHAITEEDIHRVAHINMLHGANRGGFTMAILAAKPYPVVLARLHKILSSVAGIHVEIFSDLDAAYEWLEVTRPKN